MSKKYIRRRIEKNKIGSGVVDIVRKVCSNENFNLNLLTIIIRRREHTYVWSNSSTYFCSIRFALESK